MDQNQSCVTEISSLGSRPFQFGPESTMFFVRQELRSNTLALSAKESTPPQGSSRAFAQVGVLEPLVCSLWFPFNG